MSYIPDCREEFLTDIRTGEPTEEKNGYYEGNLNKEDALEIKGYDWCAEEVVDNFFDNLDTYFPEDSYFGHTLNEKVPGEPEEYEFEWRFGEREPETRKVETYADLLRMNLIDWMENMRDELIVSMIDGYPEEEEE